MIEFEENDNSEVCREPYGTFRLICRQRIPLQSVPIAEGGSQLVHAPWSVPRFPTACVFRRSNHSILGAFSLRCSAGQEGGVVVSAGPGEVGADEFFAKDCVLTGADRCGMEQARRDAGPLSPGTCRATSALFVGCFAPPPPPTKAPGFGRGNYESKHPADSAF